MWAAAQGDPTLKQLRVQVPRSNSMAGMGAASLRTASSPLAGAAGGSGGFENMLRDNDFPAAAVVRLVKLLRYVPAALQRVDCKQMQADSVEDCALC